MTLLGPFVITVTYVLVSYPVSQGNQIATLSNERSGYFWDVDTDTISVLDNDLIV
ncbi:hypothetical protein Caka_0511 [Coraliomargarita akajimensis DSM 45221]|uniref:Uncharacterized protein n=1 Tax=Coraliomargarita akajimensis (strain DSM 45221 / IAM 15411 / JCM 23193 / KCTC 12865 / 04OKA010-24) TaxID=583355 RepID=D5ENA1_CORAD|nr:hypothetical protein Caka_0511 [Coraliomargarita akajimensis DSM 45221]